MLNNTERLALVALVRMARNNRHATAIRLASAIGVTPAEAREALTSLDAKGFADAERVRLSLNGLVVAMSLGSCASVGAPRTKAKALRAA